MSRPARVFFVAMAAVAVSALAAACGTQRISVPKSQGPLYQGAVLFNQRCSGCHTLSYAATHGSAANVRSAQANNGPNFNVRCERPAARVLYAIENGGFSGVIMPQNVVVGQDAVNVAEFVATYAGRAAPKIPNVPPCQTKSVQPLIPVTVNAASTGATKKTTTTMKAASSRSKRAASAKQRAASASNTAKNTQSRTHVATP